MIVDDDRTLANAKLFLIHMQILILSDEIWIAVYM